MSARKDHAAKSTCPKGHVYDRVDKDGWRRCSTCRKARTALANEQRSEDLVRRAGRPRPARCEVCGNRCAKNQRLAFDHDHSTDTFRGWLCSACNAALGMAGDNPQILRALAAYLDQRPRTLLRPLIT